MAIITACPLPELVYATLSFIISILLYFDGMWALSVYLIMKLEGAGKVAQARAGALSLPLRLISMTFFVSKPFITCLHVHEVNSLLVCQSICN